MKKFFCLLLFTSNFLLAQHNVALLHIEDNTLPNTTESDVAFSEIPFELAGGMIVVQASANGETGNFILDTGAPGIVLNAIDNGTANIRQGASVGGGMPVGEIEVKNFQLGIIHKEKTQGHLLNVHHLETACGMNIMGLIGFDVIRNYELLFDFAEKKIRAFKSGEERIDKGSKPILAIPFTLYGHVPVIMAKVGGKRALLGLDSGAEINLLDAKYLSKIRSTEFSNIQSELLTGLDNVLNEVVAADVDKTSLKGMELPKMRYVFTDLSHLRTGFNVPLDGLLGIPFFKSKLVSIDYAQKKIFIWQ